MKATLLPVPAGLRERDKLKSRTIERAGFANRGVIFTTSNQPSDQDFVTNLLVGTSLEHVNRAPEDDRFFEILGGYFFGKDKNGTFRTTSVFGICLERNQGFEIEEEGTVILHNHWKIFHPDQPGLDEHMNNDDGKPSEGWTFIVVPNNDHTLYPRSKDPLAIHINCGEISGITVDYSEQSKETQSVAVAIGIDGPTPDSFEIDWGDGTVDELTQPSAIHTYKRGKKDETFTVNISCKGPGPCADGGTAEVKISAMEIELVCPSISGLKTEVVSQDDLKTKIKVTATTTGETPDSFSWTWGDGSQVETTTVGEAIHEYDRDKDVAQVYKISLEVIGPKECKTSGEIEVTIPKQDVIICPVISELKAEVIEQNALKTKIKVTATTTGEKPDSFNWTWGDGSQVETTSAGEAIHEFDRSKDADQTYTISLEVIGPKECRTSGEVKVVIPKQDAACPNLDRINITVEEENKHTVTIKANLDISGPTPTSFTWKWGDGSPLETTNKPEATHTYQKAGSEKDYLILVEIIGPEACRSAGSRNYQVGPKTVDCPEITLVKLVSLTEAAEGKCLAKFQATGNGKPDSYVWEWGDGSAKETSTTNSAQHVYTQSESETKYQVKVTAKGPGSCESSKAGEVVIPALPVKETPLMCRIMPYIVAFLGALLTGSLMVSFVAEIVEGGSNADILITTGVLFVAFAVAVFLWMNLGKKNHCPPGVCEWLAVGWVSMLAGLGTSFFLIQCLESWQIWAIGFFIATGVLAYFWFKNCGEKAKAQTFFTYFVIAAVALLLSVYLIAVPVLACV